MTATPPHYSFNTDMFVDALAQYEPVTKLLNFNLRFKLLYAPLSDPLAAWPWWATGRS
jgi:hypothetical protein